MAELANKRHERFVHNLLEGMSQYDAYIDVYPNSKNWKRSSVDTAAYKLAANAEISHRFSELQQAAIDANVMDRNERMITLTEIARDVNNFPKARMQAIDLLNKMSGEYVDRKQIEAIVNTPIEDAANRIKELIAEVKSDGS